MIDGDGYLGRYKLDLVGNESIINQWCSFVSHVSGRRPRIELVRGQIVRALVYSSVRQRVLLSLYLDAPVEARLERKFQTAMKLLSLTLDQGSLAV